MTDNEIIKCLRHCRAGDCEECKALGACNATFSFHKNALDLINRQKAEIEKLEATKNAYKLYCEKTELLLTDAYKAAEQVSKNWEIGKINAIKEFAERLKEKLQWDVEFENKIVFENDIDNLVKEMEVEE